MTTGTALTRYGVHNLLAMVSISGQNESRVKMVVYWKLNFWGKGYFHLCPRIDFLQTLHINNSLYTNYENVFIELDS